MSDDEPIYSYSDDDAINDGVLIQPYAEKFRGFCLALGYIRQSMMRLPRASAITTSALSR